MIYVLDFLHVIALLSHIVAVYTGILVFSKYQDLLRDVSVHETFSLHGLINSFMVRRLYIISFTTMTCVLFSVKLLEAFTKREIGAQDLQFFFEWAAIDILVGVALFLLHLDMLKDKRRRHSAGDAKGDCTSE